MATHSADQVLNMATNVRDCAWPADVAEYMVLIEPMLRELAERIKVDEGVVSDADVETACAAYDAATSSVYRSVSNAAQMRAALLSVWPNPPAQVAQVDVDELIGAYDDAVRSQRESGFLPPAAQQAARACVEHNRNRLRNAILAAPTAEPVAQGEVVACWRYYNSLGEVVSEWIDGAPPERLYDLCNNDITDQITVECAYTTPPAQPAERVVEGMVLVPMEPTAVMTGAGWVEMQMPFGGTAKVAAIYRAMLTAAQEADRG